MNNKHQKLLEAVFLLFGISAGLIIVIGIKSIPAETFTDFSLIQLVLLPLLIYLGVFLSIIIHETGHLVFGLISGYKFSSFRIASFIILSDNGKMKLRRHSLAGTGGQCLMAPPDMKDGKIPVILYNLGGCIMNLIFALIFLLLYFLSAASSFLSVIFLTFSVIGFLVVLTNGIPMHTANIDNDGYNAFALRNNPEAVRGLWVQLKAVEQISKGVRLKDMPDEWFDIPSDEAMKNSMVAARCVFACNRLTDAGEFDKADALMAHMLEIESGIVGIHRNLLMCDRIYIELINENRRDVIDSMLSPELKKFIKAMKKYPSVIRTQYALAVLHDKNKSAADKYMKLFEKVAKIHPYPCETEAENELIQKVKEISC